MLYEVYFKAMFFGVYRYILNCLSMIFRFFFITIMFFCLLMIVRYLIASLNIILVLVRFKVTLISISNFCNNMLMQVLVGECQVLTLIGSRNSDNNRVFYLFGEVMPFLQLVRDLNLIPASNLPFDGHCLSIVKKLPRLINLIFKIFKLELPNFLSNYTSVMSSRYLFTPASYIFLSLSQILNLLRVFGKHLQSVLRSKIFLFELRQ